MLGRLRGWLGGWLSDEPRDVPPVGPGWWREWSAGVEDGVDPSLPPARLTEQGMVDTLHRSTAGRVLHDEDAL